MAWAPARALRTLYDAGCRDFFVAIWSEVEALGAIPADAALSVLHGVGADNLQAALSSSARPVLNTVEQAARWKEAAPGRACDVMIDTGMNRLGLRPEEVSVLDGLAIDTLHSHLACADEDHDLNGRQLRRFREVAPWFRRGATAWLIPQASSSAAITASISCGRASRSMAGYRARKPR
jgi:alanine racemase